MLYDTTQEQICELTFYFSHTLSVLKIANRDVVVVFKTVRTLDWSSANESHGTNQIMKNTKHQIVAITFQADSIVEKALKPKNR